MTLLHRSVGLWFVVLVIGWTTAFAPIVVKNPKQPFYISRPRLAEQPQPQLLPPFGGSRTTALAAFRTSATTDADNNNSKSTKHLLFQRLFHTAADAGYPNAQTAGVLGPIKKIHNPITYLLLALAAGIRWQWCFRSPYYWFAVGFCIKWYRARYVFKIPVWDRQPNWNNIITSKEQEKDLKAYTCKNCGSTLFIAKTREFFFEGDTGIGGLGCFTCGAKGKDNFIMDRDRIVEDVADVDDYFEYERPLDFVSRAERRKVLKEAAGDEIKANQLLVERANKAAGVVTAEVVETETVPTDNVETAIEEAVEETVSEGTSVQQEPEVKEVIEVTKKAKSASKKKKKFVPPPPIATASDDDLDILDMDI